VTRLGELVTLYSRVHGVGVHELAEQIGTSKATISRFMNGKAVSQDVMLKLINWLFSSSTETKT